MKVVIRILLVIAVIYNVVMVGKVRHNWIMLLILAVCALGLNISVKKP